MWIARRSTAVSTYYTGKDRNPWSSRLRDAHVYESLEEAEAAVDSMDWPTPLRGIEYEELPDLMIASKYL